MGLARMFVIMAVAWGFAAGCSSVGDQGDNTTDAAVIDAPAIDSAAATACLSDADCVAAYYDHPVTSVSDCTCPTCALVPVNVTTEDAYAAQWQQYCADYAATAHCLALPCVAPPLIMCVAGSCQAVARN